MRRLHTIDLLDRGTPGLIAAYVVESSDGPVLIETGPASTFANLVKGLAAIGLTPGEIRHALVTHIHFDHAGAAGHLAREGATIHVHEFGARHLADPSRLVASAARIYGDELERRWGKIIPVPEDRLAPLHGGDVVRIGDVALGVIETPGHARHHHAFRLETPDGPVCFTGDVAACFIPGCEFISLPTPPPEFDLEAWLASLRRLEEARFVRLYVTHFGAVDDPAAHLERVRRELITHVAHVRSLAEEGLSPGRIEEIYRRFVDATADGHAVPSALRRFYVRDSVAAMNVGGILRYLQKSLAPAATPA